MGEWGARRAPKLSRRRQTGTAPARACSGSHRRANSRTGPSSDRDRLPRPPTDRLGAQCRSRRRSRRRNCYCSRCRRRRRNCRRSRCRRRRRLRTGRTDAFRAFPPPRPHLRAPPHRSGRRGGPRPPSRRADGRRRRRSRPRPSHRPTPHWTAPAPPFPPPHPHAPTPTHIHTAAAFPGNREKGKKQRGGAGYCCRARRERQCAGTRTGRVAGSRRCAATRGSPPRTAGRPNCEGRQAGEAKFHGATDSRHDHPPHPHSGAL